MLRTTEGAPPIAEESVNEFEKRHDIRLPQAYREFLCTRNGGRPERDLFVVPGCKASPYARIHFFFGIGGSYECYDLDWNIQWSDGRFGAELWPIATTEGADRICMRLPLGEIVFWDGYEGGSVYPVAVNFEEFIGKLYSDEHSPHFDPLN